LAFEGKKLCNEEVVKLGIAFYLGKKEESEELQ
jgi:hypothetical protein